MTTSKQPVDKSSKEFRQLHNLQLLMYTALTIWLMMESALFAARRMQFTMLALLPVFWIVYILIVYLLFPVMAVAYISGVLMLRYRYPNQGIRVFRESSGHVFLAALAIAGWVYWLTS